MTVLRGAPSVPRVLRVRMDGALVWLSWESAGAPRLVFSTRRGGVSPPPYQSLNLGLSTRDDPTRVEENRARLLKAAGGEAARLATAGQVHGTDVRVVTAAGHHSGCDALLTDRPGIALAVSGADCAPVLLWGPGAVAAVHAGWRGAADGIAGAAVRSLAARTPCAPAEVRALIGPCIRACCYPVGPEVLARFDASAHVVRDGTTRLDLARAIGMDLERSGVREWHDVGRCTSCEVEWFYSHRRDRGVTGRQWGLVIIDQAHAA